MNVRDVLWRVSLLKSEYLLLHHAGVMLYAERLAGAVAPGLRAGVLAAAAWHDVGKAFVPDEVLLKPGDLTSGEWRRMREHPIVGAQLLARDGQGSLFWTSDVWVLAVKTVRHHHERWDGLGYPDGLAGGETPLAARIIAVADVYDAMTTDRPYRKALSREEALRRILAGAGTQFDPRLAEVFVHLMEAGAASAANFRWG